MRYVGEDFSHSQDVSFLQNCGLVGYKLVVARSELLQKREDGLVLAVCEGDGRSYRLGIVNYLRG